MLFIQMLLWVQRMCKCKGKPKVKQPGRMERKREALNPQNLHLPIFYCPIICRNHWYCVAASQQPDLQSQTCEIYGGVKSMQCLLWSGLISWKLEKSFQNIMQIEF